MRLSGRMPVRRYDSYRYLNSCEGSSGACMAKKTSCTSAVWSIVKAETVSGRIVSRSATPRASEFTSDCNAVAFDTSKPIATAPLSRNTTQVTELLPWSPHLAASVHQYLRATVVAVFELGEKVPQHWLV